MPNPSNELLILFRSVYGMLLALHLGLSLWSGRRFFIGERWGGYGLSSPWADRIENPRTFSVVCPVWFACAALLTFGRLTLAAALVNLALCRWYFVARRWGAVSRGMGAPGFMTYWLAAGVAALEVARAAGENAVSLVVLVLQLDFGLVMLSAAVYKAAAGYPRNEGIQYGLSNPAWGYWHSFYAKLPPRHGFFRFTNQCAWSIQLLASILMLIPPTRAFGAAAVVGSFLFVASQIRLGVLCPMVILGALLFVPAGSLPDEAVRSAVAWLGLPPTTASTAPAGIFGATVMSASWAYLALLPLAYGGLYLNFYGRRPLPGRAQHLLERYTNFFGIILWRVFTADITNFFVRVHRQSHDGRRELLSHYGRIASRFNFVGESVTVTCVFTTLKYYPSDSARFTERLLAYARTLPRARGEIHVFEYVSICGQGEEFRFLSPAEFLVDVEAGTVIEKWLDEATSHRAAHKHSPVFEGARPGSYVAKGA